MRKKIHQTVPRQQNSTKHGKTARAAGRGGRTRTQEGHAREKTKDTECLMDSVHRVRAIPDRNANSSGPTRVVFFSLD
jgi:hypothetical protein